MLAGYRCRYVDGGIIGGPHRRPTTAQRLYVSGEAAQRGVRLANYGLTVRVLDGPIGMASALKMSYGGITKGLHRRSAPR